MGVIAIVTKLCSRIPQMALHIHAVTDKGHALGLQPFAHHEGRLEMHASG